MSTLTDQTEDSGIAYSDYDEKAGSAYLSPYPLMDMVTPVPRPGAGQDSPIPKDARLPETPPNYLAFEVTQATAQPQGVEVLGGQLGFPARTVMVDNLTPQWVYVRNCRRYIAPYTLGVIYPIIDAAEIASCRFEVPPGTTAAFTQPTANAGSRVILLFVESQLDPSPGVLLQTVASLPA